MQTMNLISDALAWAFNMFFQHLKLFAKLFLLSGAITIITALCTLGIALLIVPFYLTMCHIKIALKLYDNQPINSIKEDFFVDVHTFLKGLGALYLYTLIVNAGFVLFVIPGIYLASRYYYIIYAIVADRKDIMQSFTYSEQLTAPLPWHGFLLLLCATLLGGSLIFLGVAALMNVYAYKQCQKMHL